VGEAKRIPPDRVVRVRLGRRSYEIGIGEGRLDRLGRALASLGPFSRAVLVTDTNVRALYGERAERAVAEAGIPCTTIGVPPGERTKAAGALVRLWDGMLDAGVDRRSVVVALGGGVVGDLAGFAAATVLRGIALVQVPTTLLSQVDSSVGGKTGIDRPRGKNLVGAFWQPAAVEIDPGTLSTLPDRELRAGLGEVVKTGVIRSEALFERLESRAEALLRKDAAALGEVVARSCKVKAKVVGKDERDESGERAVLNLGHTVGHAIEAAAGYERILHGEAVAVGMVAAGRIALRLGLWDEEAEERVERLLARFGLPVDLGGLGLSEDEIMRHLLSDKKAVGGKLYFVLPEELGFASLQREPVPEKVVREVVRTLQPATE
jgi:3-dehydroquinate synthase